LQTFPTPLSFIGAYFPDVPLSLEVRGEVYRELTIMTLVSSRREETMIVDGRPIIAWVVLTQWRYISVWRTNGRTDGQTYS